MFVPLGVDASKLWKLGTYRTWDIKDSSAVYCSRGDTENTSSLGP